MSTLTAQVIRDAADRIGRVSSPLAGMQVVEVPVRMGPAREHSRRRNGGKRSYHGRVQKKWLKRWGMADRTTVRPGEVLMLGQHTLFIRADDMPLIRQVQTHLTSGDSE
jgi:hypothetical protein